MSVLGDLHILYLKAFGLCPVGEDRLKIGDCDPLSPAEIAEIKYQTGSRTIQQRATALTININEYTLIESVCAHILRHHDLLLGINFELHYPQGAHFSWDTFEDEIRKILDDISFPTITVIAGIGKLQYIPNIRNHFSWCTPDMQQRAKKQRTQRPDNFWQQLSCKQPQHYAPFFTKYRQSILILILSGKRTKSILLPIELWRIIFEFAKI